VIPCKLLSVQTKISVTCRGKDRRDRPDSNLHRKVESFVNMAAELGSRDGKGGMVHGVRSLGSATLDLAYCAMGSFDIWWVVTMHLGP
jgi:myo-inositol-1(or 4)-monophosphatase